MQRGPTITSGHERDFDWRAGLEDAVFLCTGRRTTDSAVTSPSHSCMIPTTQANPGGGSWMPDNLLGSFDCPVSIKQELPPGLNSTSIDSSFDQQPMGLTAGRLAGDCAPLQSLSERQDESRVGFPEPQPTKTAFSGFDAEPQVKERRKVGRPIMHKGDPDDPSLTEKERRRIKRRIANRESARRVRYRRQEEMEELQGKMEEILEKNRELRTRAEDALQQRNHLAGEVEVLHRQLGCMTAENQKMEIECHALRGSLQVKMCALESELDRREAVTGGTGALPSAFGNTTVNPLALNPLAINPLAMAAAHHLPPQVCHAPSNMPLGNGGMSLFPSLDLDRMNQEALPGYANLDCLLDSSYNNCAN